MYNSSAKYFFIGIWIYLYAFYTLYIWKFNTIDHIVSFQGIKTDQSVHPIEIAAFQLFIWKICNQRIFTRFSFYSGSKQ